MDNLNLINWTPHDIVIYDEDGKNVILTIKKSSFSGRLESEYQSLGNSIIDNIEIPIISKCEYKGFIDLPNFWKQLDTCDVVVSMPVAEFLYELHISKNRTTRFKNIFIPDSGPDSSVRDTKGQIIGVKRLVRYI